mmetsp:Transcript_51959/g.97200  ORF Transcript_51959/g.97200 Transcript_51959/m.97200 type:complete len:271 (+) Transcript_51959:403-1215(+)
MTWELDGTLQHLLVDAIRVLIIEWRISCQHLEEKDAQSPPVHALAVALGLDHLRGQVLWRTAKRPSSFFHDLGETEVREFDVPFHVQQSILWLQVPVHDVQAVEIPKGHNDLTGVKSNLVVWKTPLISQVREQLAAVYVLQQHEQSPLILKSAQEVDNEGMLDHGHDLLFCLHMLHLLQSDYIAFPEDLQCHGSPLLASLHLDHANAAEGTLPDGVFELEIRKGPCSTFCPCLELRNREGLGRVGNIQRLVFLQHVPPRHARRSLSSRSG